MKPLQTLVHSTHRHRRDQHHHRNSCVEVIVDDFSMPLSVSSTCDNRRSSLIEAINEALLFQSKQKEEREDDDVDDNDLKHDVDAELQKGERERERNHEHMKSTLALCSSLFTMIFILSSLFPYSGFMVMELLEPSSSSSSTTSSTAPKITKETVGIYAGVLTSAFMIGRASSAVLWGHASDVYGRKFCLYVGSVSNAIGSLAFGLCTTSFISAFIIRFLMGFLNGTMVVSRTMISELSNGDKILESKGVGLLM
eukprot:CAMPEP_0113502508 /NCGR_PEP_ID=MMETSP0014_2-20120614/33598_1 /TAXON_ID=2857 /ORGANISM="Nitzschia sp." /LENGTH=253 /DNA_ID=CAMNT_0000397313 /DNA_START=229 /DNA_END=987 /DNA_ORIENTATION=+ /assembly_acc=CAM_ASM_000159